MAFATRAVVHRMELEHVDPTIASICSFHFRMGSPRGCLVVATASPRLGVTASPFPPRAIVSLRPVQKRHLRLTALFRRRDWEGG